MTDCYSIPCVCNSCLRDYDWKGIGKHAIHYKHNLPSFGWGLSCL